MKEVYLYALFIGLIVWTFGMVVGYYELKKKKLKGTA